MDLALVERLLLAQHSGPTVTNQYCPLQGDAGRSSGERIDRVLSHLRARTLSPLIVVGEAAGWRGARQTGVAFTAPRHLRPGGLREASATVVQDFLSAACRGSAVLWNAFPWHPHPPGRPDANRAPSAAEIRSGLPLLRDVCEGRAVLAVGRRAAAAVSACLDVEVPDAGSGTGPAAALAVRHPSFGGAAEFRTGAAAALPRLTGKTQA